MKQSVFYRCMISGDKCYAQRTLGYADGGIGLFKESTGWTATHIPTGAKITPHSSKHKTAKQSLLEAENLISESRNIIGTIQHVRSHIGFDSFLVDRRRQQLLISEVDADESPF